mgnify:CR=1 FL=1
MATMSVSAGEAASSEGEAVRREVALGGGTLSVLDFGGDGPPLHFAHANGFNGLTYRRLLAPLTRAFRITAWDARGHGRSQLPADPGTHSNWLVYRDDLIAYLETVVAAEGALDEVVEVEAQDFFGIPFRKALREPVVAADGTALNMHEVEAARGAATAATNVHEKIPPANSARRKRKP